MADRYVVFGNPVKHSLSPRIHKMFAEQTKQKIEYERFLVEDDFHEKSKSFFLAGGKGANVTLPYKEEAFKLADNLSERAQAAGAVNTLIYKEGKIYGDNTDGAGLVNDLESQLGSLKDRRILLLGAGGAAKGVIIPLFNAGIASLHIANRTESKAQDMAVRFSTYGRITASGYDDIPNETFEVIINSTSSSISGDVPAINTDLFFNAKLAYDMFYQKEPTSFMVSALRHNSDIKVSDGLGMLVGQAAESFFLWRGVKPDIKPVIRKLKAEMA